MKKAILFLFLAAPCFATDFPVHTGGNIQTAINSAASAGVGSTVTIDAGATFTPQLLTLPVVTGCTTGQYVTIRTSLFASLPSGRVSPANVTLMPTIKQTGADIGGVFFLAPGTHGGCWQLLGLEITTYGANQMVNFLVNFQDVTADSLVVDRCYIHSAEGSTGRTAPYNSSIGLGGVLSDGSHVIVENSYINGMWGLPLGGVAGNSMTQSSAIGADQGPCNTCLWTNNYLEGGYSGIQMGGAPQNGTVGATVSASPAPTVNSATLSSVSGITVNMPIALQVPWSAAYCKRGNTFPCWGDGVVTSIVGSTINFTTLFGEDNSSNRQPTAAPFVGGNVIWTGTQMGNITITRNWIVFNYAFEFWLRFTSGNGNHDKGFMEIKNGNNLDIEANVFGDYGGWPSVFGLGNEQNQVGDSPFATQSNITIKNNWLRAFKECSYFGDSATGGYFGYLNTFSDNIDIENNLCEGPDTLAIDSQPATAFVFAVGKTFTYKHNTVLTGYPNIYSGAVMSYDPSPLSAYGTAWTPAVTFKDNLVGWGNYNFGCSGGAVSACWGPYTELDNIFALCNNSGCPVPDNPVADGTFTHSTAVTNWNSILFTNSSTHTWSLTPSSPGYHAASDGTDVGVNFAALSAATAGVATTGGGGGGPFSMTVNSTNPNSGVTVTNSPADNNSVSSCSTPCTLIFNSGTSVAETFPNTASGNSLTSLTGFDSTSGNVGTKVVSSNLSVSGNYTTPTFTLTINSTSPSAGITMTVSPADNNGHSSCSTSCVLVYNTGTSVTVTAPSTSGTSTFSNWTGCDSVVSTACTKAVSANVIVTANYTVTTFTVAIGSTNPSSGVTVALSPADNGGHSSCSTPCSLNYNSGVTITATVSATNFTNWTSCPSPSSNVCTVGTISGNQSFTANYTTPPPPTFTLNVQSVTPATGVVIAVSPSDTGGHSNVTTLGSLTYVSATSVTLTAPITASGNNFSSWAGCDSVVTNACTVAMGATRTVTVTYTPPSPTGPTVPPGKVPLMVTAPNALLTLQPADANGVNSGTSFALTASSYSLGVKFPENGSCITPQSHNKQVWTCSWKIISGTQTQCTCQ